MSEAKAAAKETELTAKEKELTELRELSSNNDHKHLEELANKEREVQQISQKLSKLREGQQRISNT